MPFSSLEFVIAKISALETGPISVIPASIFLVGHGLAINSNLGADITQGAIPTHVTSAIAETVFFSNAMLLAENIHFDNACLIQVGNFIELH